MPGRRAAAGSVALSGGVAHPSDPAVVPVGGLSYRAQYKGDETYNPSTGPCETLAGDKLDSTTRPTSTGRKDTRADHVSADRLDGA